MVGGKSLIENTTKNQSSHFSIIYQPPFLLHIPTLLLFSHTAPSSPSFPKETGNTIPSMYLHILCISFGFKRSSPTRPSLPKVKFTELLWGLTILMGGKWRELIRPKNNWGMDNRNHIKTNAAESVWSTSCYSWGAYEGVFRMQSPGRKIWMTTATVSPNWIFVWIIVEYGIPSGETQPHRCQAWQADLSWFSVPTDHLERVFLWIGHNLHNLSQDSNVGLCLTETGREGEKDLIHLIFLVGGGHCIRWRIHQKGKWRRRIKKKFKYWKNIEKDPLHAQGSKDIICYIISFSFSLEWKYL